MALCRVDRRNSADDTLLERPASIAQQNPLSPPLLAPQTLRGPNGIAIDSKDRLFVTDNQGDWVASSPIYHIHEGSFYGHPKSLDWTESYRAAGKLAHDEIPPAEASVGREAPAIWIPYKWSRSTGNRWLGPNGPFSLRWALPAASATWNWP